MNTYYDLVSSREKKAPSTKMKARDDSTELVMQELIQRLFEEKNLLKEQNRILMENVRDLKEQNCMFQESHSTGAVSYKKKTFANSLKTTYADACRNTESAVPSSRRMSNSVYVNKSNRPSSSEVSRISGETEMCKFCGTDHIWRRDKCPAFNARCSNCFKKNHSADVCFLHVEKITNSNSASCI